MLKGKHEVETWDWAERVRTVTCWKVEVETLDWAERVVNYHVLES